MLPRRVALAFQKNKSVEAERMENVTMYCSDIVDFTDIASKSSPMEVKSETLLFPMKYHGPVT